MKAVNWDEVMGMRPELRSEGLTPEEETQLRSLLLKVKIGGRLSLPIFLWTRAMFVSPSVEVIFYRYKVGEGNKFLLKRRPGRADDPVYGGKLGVIGKVMVPSDVIEGDHDQYGEYSLRKVLSSALAEIGLKDEDIPFNPGQSDPWVIKARLFDGDRGPVAQILVKWEIPHSVEVKGVEWATIDNLPPDIIEEHRSLLLLADANM